MNTLFLVNRVLMFPRRSYRCPNGQKSSVYREAQARADARYPFLFSFLSNDRMLRAILSDWCFLFYVILREETWFSQAPRPPGVRSLIRTLSCLFRSTLLYSQLTYVYHKFGRMRYLIHQSNYYESLQISKLREFESGLDSIQRRDLREFLSLMSDVCDQNYNHVLNL